MTQSIQITVTLSPSIGNFRGLTSDIELRAKLVNIYRSILEGFPSSTVECMLTTSTPTKVSMLPHSQLSLVEVGKDTLEKDRNLTAVDGTLLVSGTTCDQLNSR